MADESSARGHTVQDLKNRSPLWYKLHVFIYDLRSFREKADSQARLDSIIDPFYLGLPYVQYDEAEYLKATLINGKPLHQIIRNILQERLERRMKKRVESADYRVCAAHDLAPIFETSFGIKPKDLATNTRFQELLVTYGLGLGEGEEFGGLVHAAKNEPANVKPTATAQQLLKPTADESVELVTAPSVETTTEQPAEPLTGPAH
ncbi:MAG: hypothetical protein Q9218_007144, partial [Villophora microphyllina]